MTKAREAIPEKLYQYRLAGRQRSVLLCYFNGMKLTCLNQACEGDVRGLPAALTTVGGFPTLATVLHLHSKVEGNKLPSLEIEKDKEKDENYLGIVAVCGYPPTRADYGMAYRNGVRFVIEMTLNGESSCHRVTQSFKPSARGELIQRDDKAGDFILDTEWVDSRGGRVVTFDDLVDHPWFDKFLTPAHPSKVKVPDYYGEDLTPDLKDRFGSLAKGGTWRPHVRAQRDSVTWWVLVSLYTSFAWGSQYPAYRSWSYLNQRKSKGFRDTKEGQEDTRMTRAYGEFLDGLNVSGLLLDPQLKPVAWSFNSNRVNKTLHAETALVLAWLKGHREEKEFVGYTFLSPWRSCCMCSGWIADVYRGSETVWFIDDPGLPLRHLDHGSNGAEEIFLPQLLEDNVRLNENFQVILDAFPWFQVMGKATHWDYNKQYLTYLNNLRKEDEKGEFKGPVDLFGCQEYFRHLEAAWSMTQNLPTSLLNLLDKCGELEPYVNNIWALRRCVMAFDDM